MHWHGTELSAVPKGMASENSITLCKKQKVNLKTPIVWKKTVFEEHDCLTHTVQKICTAKLKKKD